MRPRKLLQIITLPKFNLTRVISIELFTNQNVRFIRHKRTYTFSHKKIL